MDLKALKTIKTTNYELSKIQDNVSEFLNQLKSTQMIVGVEISGSITSAGEIFNHGLGRKPSGWFLTDINSNVNLWRTGWDEKSISLDASGDAIFKAWVY